MNASSPGYPGRRHRGHACVAAALLSALALAGCERGPSRAQIQSDVSTRQPDCRVVRHLAGEGDAEQVYFLLTLDCRKPPQLRDAEAGYRRQEGEWRMFHFEQASTPQR